MDYSNTDDCIHHLYRTFTPRETYSRTDLQSREDTSSSWSLWGTNTDIDVDDGADSSGFDFFGAFFDSIGHNSGGGGTSVFATSNDDEW